jgi:hypothetical protein
MLDAVGIIGGETHLHAVFAHFTVADATDLEVSAQHFDRRCHDVAWLGDLPQAIGQQEQELVTLIAVLQRGCHIATNA